MNKRRLEKHAYKMQRLQRKKEIAELKLEERKIKHEILAIRFPFINSKTKFSKKAVIISIVVPVVYTVVAFLLQKNTGLEISPTLTGCVFGFFGTELFNASRIKMNEDKFRNDDYIGE